jgi:peptide/nickel transport system permease protein
MRSRLEAKRVLREILWVRKSSGIGALVVVIVVASAIFAPLLAPQSPAQQDLRNRYAQPSAEHWFGTDNFGRDVYSRVLWGARISLSVGVVSVLIAAGVGGVLGLVAGFAGGFADRAINFFVEILMAFPLLLLAIAMLAALGPGIGNVMIAVGVSSVPLFARVIRAETRALRERDFVTAAHALGSSSARTLFAHIAPNVLASLIVLASTRLATAMLAEAGLSFLGIGIRPPTPTWGVMVAEGRVFLERAPWLALIPGGAIMVTVLAFNLLGDGLRDALDVRSRIGGARAKT